MITNNDLLEALPVAVYTTDAEGRITFYNAAAAAFWGHTPEPNTRWCGSWRLRWPDGTVMRHDECPMAQMLREGRPIRGVEAIAERPDGTLVPFMPYPTPLRDSSGKLIGGINLLIETGERAKAEIDRERLAAIVASSDDAIVSKTLEGIVTSWNASAARIFGYSADEMLGQSILKIIPRELQAEEETILSRLKRGERIEHFDTVRLAKDGRRVNVSLTVSPLRGRNGAVVGASKIARDVTERKRAEDLQRLLFEELNHRVKNTLATIQSIATQSLRRAANPADFEASFTGRLRALARAHDLLVRGKMSGAGVAEIMRDQVLLGAAGDSRVSADGPAVLLDMRAAVQLALVLHELATNARKYGALATPDGRLSLSWHVETNGGGNELFIEWRERGVASVKAPTTHGFGTTLIERTLEANGGKATIHYTAGGISCEIRLPLAEAGRLPFEEGVSVVDASQTPASGAMATDALHGKCVLLVEDEPIIAMDIEARLESAGCKVAGPASTLAAAKRLIDETHLDAALVDANLAGYPVDELVAALARKGVPFAFATGYARDGLPIGFRDAPILTKPFTDAELLAILRQLVDRNPTHDRTVVSLRRDRGGSSTR